MSNMELNKKTKLTILLTSLAFAVIFLIIGIAVLSNDDTRKLEYATTRYDSASYGTEYTYEFDPSYSGTYYLKIEGGYLVNVEDNNGNYVSYSIGSSYYYNDYDYKITLSANKTYKFVVCADDNEIEIYIS